MNIDNRKLSWDYANRLAPIYKSNNLIKESKYANLDIKRGLRNQDGTGVLAGLTSIASVQGYMVSDGERVSCAGKLIYRGIDLSDLIQGCLEDDRNGFEETAYLLLFGQLPAPLQLKEFENILGEYMTLPEHFTEDMILKAPSSNIMNKLTRSVLALYSYDNNPDVTSLENMLRQSIELIARFPTIVAHAYAVKRHYYNNESLYLHRPLPNLSLAENFLYSIRPDNSYTKEEAGLLDLCLMIHAEHGGGNNSAFACRVLSSSGTDTYSAISAACGSLKGPKHGGANQKVMEMFREVQSNVQDWSDDTQVYDYLCKILRKDSGDGSGLIYGMGHAVYTESDPRAVILKKAARSVAEKKGISQMLDLMESIERLTPQAYLDVTKNDKQMCANVDMYSGLIYHMLDIPIELHTPIFAIARVVGWCAHRIEEAALGGRIIRPAYKATTPEKQYIPLDERV